MAAASPAMSLMRCVSTFCMAFSPPRRKSRRVVSTAAFAALAHETSMSAPNRFELSEKVRLSVGFLRRAVVEVDDVAAFVL